MQLTEVHIEKLFGKFDVHLNIKDNKLILIGPNGSGKSTILNVIYFILSRQWSRLREVNFTSVSLTVDNQPIVILKDALEYWVSFSERRGRPVSRYADRLRDAGLLEEFIELKEFDIKSRTKFGNLLRVPFQILKSLQADLRAEFPKDLFSSAIKKAAVELEEKIKERVLFLPTYRRIERELQAIFPQIEEAFRRYTEQDVAFVSRRSKHYIELVSFGMQDVRGLVDAKLASVREFSRNQLNNLAGSYLTDVIREQAEQFDPKSLGELADEDIDNILQIMDEKSLSSNDKSVIRQEMSAIRNHGPGRLTHRQKYLAHFFVKLRGAADLIKSNDEPLRALAAVCNNYLKPDKVAIYDDVKFSWEVSDQDGDGLDLKDLSSGEKQIISLFAHLLLDASENNIVIIDEPELSLSVPWQEQFLPDVLLTKKCSLLLAVTHSPFTYDNKLNEYSRAVGECVSRSQ